MVAIVNPTFVIFSCNFLINAEQNQIWIKVDDDYNSLPKKVINAYEAISKIYHFKYIFKTDDDQMVSPVRFFDTLINILDAKYNDPVFSNRVHYGGHIVDVKQSYKSEYCKIHPELPTDLIVKKRNIVVDGFICYHIM